MRSPRSSVTPSRSSQNGDRLRSMAAVAESFRSFRPAAQVVQQVSAVPTIFPDLDRVLGVGGLPTERVIVVHGPSSNGKTSLSLGLLLSFLRRDHFAALVDAERTTPAEWLRGLFGEAFAHPGFVALEVGTYEKTRDDVRDYFDRVAEARRAGDLPDDARAICLVDSIKKLVPKKLWDELQKAVAADAEEESKQRGARRVRSKGGVDGVGGRAGQIKAAFNSAWLDELVPLLASTKGTIVLIAREKVEQSDDFFGGEVVTLGGGVGLNFDASLRLRCLAFPINEGEGKEKTFIGERHVVEVRKTKVHARDEAVPRAVFHTSNGARSPAGFDHARDLLACALELGVVEISGSHYKWQRGKLGQGADNALGALRRHEADARDIEALCRERMIVASAPV